MYYLNNYLLLKNKLPLLSNRFVSYYMLYLYALPLLYAFYDSENMLINFTNDFYYYFF